MAARATSARGWSPTRAQKAVPSGPPVRWLSAAPTAVVATPVPSLPLTDGAADALTSMPEPAVVARERGLSRRDRDPGRLRVTPSPKRHGPG
jgi:hypothetical protein